MQTTDITPESLAARNSALDNAKLTNRIEAFRQRQPSDTPALLVDPGGDLPDTQAKIPELPAQELTIGALRSAISQHGALIVRGLFPRESMNALMPVIDRVLAACEANSLGQPPPAGPYFDPPTNMASIMPNKARELSNTRRFHRDSGSAMCVEAPSVAESLLDWYEAKGLKHMLTAYLGEPPCLSMKKWVLRRSRLPVAEAGWHQDGAFMGTHINSLNLWIPLNQCGGETGAPGMDVLPRRLNRIAPAEGAQFNWSVSSSQVTAASGDSQLLSPEFEAGDAFFFDHFFLHRTQHGVEFDKIRYAIETWFFGENRFPKNQIPLAW